MAVPRLTLRSAYDLHEAYHMFTCRCQRLSLPLNRWDNRRPCPFPLELEAAAPSAQLNDLAEAATTAACNSNNSNSNQKETTNSNSNNNSNRLAATGETTTTNKQQPENVNHAKSTTTRLAAPAPPPRLGSRPPGRRSAAPRSAHTSEAWHTVPAG